MPEVEKVPVEYARTTLFLLIGSIGRVVWLGEGTLKLAAVRDFIGDDCGDDVAF
jgi:hypothetical protein